MVSILWSYDENFNFENIHSFIMPVSAIVQKEERIMK